jgi:hypothetical protein
MDVQQRAVHVSGLSYVSVAELGKFFSKFGVVDRVDHVDESSALILFEDASGASSALLYDGRSFRDDTVIITVPSLRILRENRFGVEQKVSLSSADTLRQNLRELVNLTPASDVVNVLDSVLSDFQASISGRDASVDASGQSSSPLSPDVVVSPSPSVISESVSVAHVVSTPSAPLCSTFAVRTPVRPPPGFAPRPRFAPQVQDPYSCYPQYSVSAPSMVYPKVVFFSGDDKDASYHQWRNEVVCLTNEGHPTSNVLQGIRRSVRGTAAVVLLNLGEDITLENILKKFDVVFGVAASSESLLEEFYTSRQGEGEPVVVWGCRLESILYKVRKFGHVTSDLQDMLRTRFWSGLRDQRVKSALRYKFELGRDFESLLVAARSVELEFGSVPGVLPPRPSQPKVNFQQSSTLESKMDDLCRQMGEMKRQLHDLQEPRNMAHPVVRGSLDAATKQRLLETNACFYCREVGHFLSGCPSLQLKKASQGSTASGNGSRPTS